MSLVYGHLRYWSADRLTAADHQLRADILALERARDTVETEAVPDSYEGFGRAMAKTRQWTLLGQMDTHVEELAAFERTVYGQVAAVAAIERTVEDIDTDAAAQQFTVHPDGTITDEAPARTFDSTFERNEFQAARAAQRDALLVRMQEALDAAYDVDGALIAARPQESFSEEGPEYVVDPAVAREWEGMSDDERRAVIEEIARQRARDAGVDDFDVRFEDLEDKNGDGVDDDPDTNSHGSWNEGDRVLRIDVGDLSDPTILGTVAHEVRHAQQHKAVDDLPWWWWEDFDGPPGVTQDEVEDWKYNFDHPKDSKTDGFDAYADQATESDARETGGDFLDGLDEEELDRLREEAR